MTPRTCRVCGCQQRRACPGGCYWVEEDLCSACVEKDEERKKAEVEGLKRQIDGMSHYDLCRRWRFARPGDPMFQGEVGEYYKHRLFQELGGFTPEISKDLGW